MNRLTSLLLILPLLASIRSTAGDVPLLVKGTDRFEFSYKVTIPRIDGSGHLWVPIASSDRFQEVKLLGVTTHKPWRETREKDFGNRILCMDLAPSDSGKSVELRYKVLRHENKGHAPEATEDPTIFLRPDKLVPENPRLAQIAIAQTQGQSSKSTKAAALYRHTLERMAYDKSGTGWGRGDALHACDSRTGNCTDFHSYFIALARSLDIPARFGIGFTIPAETDEGTIPGYHCWAEYYADGRWHPVDISEADKHPELGDYYASRHPANRFQISVGRDLSPEPLPASGPINFLVYPLLESNGKVTEAKCEFHFRRLPPKNQGGADSDPHKPVN